MSELPLAVQLWSVRESCQRDLAGTLERLTAMGYDAVEPFAWHGLSPVAFSRALRACGLRVVGFHQSWRGAPGIESELDAIAALDCSRVIVPWWDPADLQTADQVSRLAERLNGLRESAASRGMALGFHNHVWEFSHRIGGRTVHQRLFDALHPEVFAEVDVYWAAVAGVDPARVLEGLGSRVRLVHLKDGPADGEDSPMTALGAGALDLEAILVAARHCEAHVVEIDDCEGDIFEALRVSGEFVTRARRVRKLRVGSSAVEGE